MNQCKFSIGNSGQFLQLQINLTVKYIKAQGLWLFIFASNTINFVTIGKQEDHESQNKRTKG